MVAGCLSWEWERPASSVSLRHSSTMRRPRGRVPSGSRSSTSSYPQVTQECAAVHALRCCTRYHFKHCNAQELHALGILKSSFEGPQADESVYNHRRTALLPACSCILIIALLVAWAGYALGYAYGGLLVDVIGLHWRWAFGIESLFMLPFVVLGFTSKPIPLRGNHSSGAPHI